MPDVVLSAPIPTVAPADLRTRLSGTLVVLEPLGAEHLEGLGAIAGDSEMFRWIGSDLSDRATREAWITAALQSASRELEVPYAVRARRSGEVVGTTRFLGLQLEHLLVEIGWTWYARAAWGTGVNVETKLLLLGHAFETLGLRRVEFKTDSRNARSRGALAALGAQYEGTLRKHRVLADGGVRHSAYYSILDEEWPAVRIALRQRLERTGA